MKNYRMPWFVRVIFFEAVFRIKNKSNTIYLTFDDGPTAGVTDRIIKILERTGVPATFFCKGSNVKANNQLFEELLNKGFSIGNHGYEHLDGWKTGYREYYLNTIEGMKMSGSKLFRPPYGHLSTGQYRKLKKENTIIFWDVLAYDFHEEIEPDRILKKVISKIRSGSIIVMHDIEKSKVIDILDDLITRCKHKGFVFGDLGEVLLNKT